MPKTITFEGTKHQFPDDFTDADISAALESHAPSTPKDPIQRGVEAFDKTKAAFEAQPSMGLGDQLKEGAKALISPITSIPGAIMSLMHPSETAARNLNPETAGGLPGAGNVNPVMDAYGTGLAAVPAGRAAEAATRSAIMDRMGVAPEPAAPTPIADMAPGLARKVITKLGSKYPVLRGGMMAIDAAKALREVLQEQKPKPPSEVPPITGEPRSFTLPPAPNRIGDYAPKAVAAGRPVGPDYVMPEPAQIPADASPSQMAPFTPQTVLDYMKGPARPAMEAPEAAAAPADVPTEVAKRQTPGARDAQTLADKLTEWDFTPKEAQGLNEKSWAKLAFDSGVQLPSAAVRKNAISNLIKQRQGPVLPVEQLIERFRAGGRK